MSSLQIRTGEVYSQYGLTSTSFDRSQFETEWGGRLSDVGFDDIIGSILAEANERMYLENALSTEQANRVNKAETLISASDAENFRLKVARTIINESFERLIDLRLQNEAERGLWTFTDAVYHEACGDWAGKEKLFLVRETVASKLSQLASKLALLNVGVHFEDGFRPLGVQEGLFARRITMAKSAHPEWSRDELLSEARSKTAYTPRFAAHKAGAAVDVRLFDSNSGRLHDIGHDYPDGGEIVRLNTEFVTQSQWQNRKILEHLSRAVGLLMYPYEDWHLCYGDTTAAVVGATGAEYHAKYGPIKAYYSNTGDIQEIYDSGELDETFNFSR